MNNRRFGRLGWQVSEVGYGMWGVAGGEGGWTGADDAVGMQCLHRAVEHGCNFFDTAWIYGRGHSERMLGNLVRAHPGRTLYVATKVPPKNLTWPSHRGDLLQDVFPPDHVHDYVRKSLEALGREHIDLLQFHVWEDAWADDPSWQKVVEDLKRDGLVRGIGISVNRWEASNVIATLRTGLIDAVQVIYNIFDQAPADQLFPVCEQLDVAIIARVPFDEGSLCGGLTVDSRWPDGDWRNSYFVPDNLVPTVARVEALREVLPARTDMASTALRFILSHPGVATVIPGMRSLPHVDANFRSADAGPLSEEMLSLLAGHRWDREPTWWSQ